MRMWQGQAARSGVGRSLQKMAEHAAGRRHSFMSNITLAQAERIIDAAIERGVALNCRPISVIVVEPGCKVKAFKKEGGATMIRFEMAFGKAYAALSLGRSSKLVRDRAQQEPIFMRYLIGAVGVTGDTEDRDEELAIHGIHAAGLNTDEDCRHMGRKIGIRTGHS